MLRVARVTTVLGAVSAALAVSCFTKPDAPHAGNDARVPDGLPGSDAPGSGSGSSTMCAKQPWDDFKAGQDCGIWGGTLYGGSTNISWTNGTLQVTPDMTFEVGCMTNGTFSFANGTSIEIPQVASSGMSNETFFRVRSSNGADGMEVGIFHYGTTADTYVACLGSNTGSANEPYDALNHRWWKFEAQQTAVGNVVHAYHSSGPTAPWIDFTAQTCTWSQTSSVTVEMGVTTTADVGTPAKFDNFNIRTCPP
jgi:hypothetical protein